MNTDNTLIEVVRNGRGAQVGAALTELYNKYDPILHAFLRKNFTVYSEIYDEAVVIALGKALRPEKIKKWKPTATFSTWLHSIAYNAMVDIIRSEKRQDIISQEDMTADGASFAESNMELTVDNYTGQDQMEDNEVMEVIEFCIGKLSTVQSEMLRYNLLDQMNDEEIAEITGRNPIAIRTNISRGKKNLRKLLEEEGVTLLD